MNIFEEEVFHKSINLNVRSYQNIRKKHVFQNILRYIIKQEIAIRKNWKKIMKVIFTDNVNF